MIIQEILNLDKTIVAIKEKGNLNGFNQIDFYFILTLEIARFEILSSNKMTEKTSEAITQLFTFQIHEYYYREFPELYNVCSTLFSSLIEYNKELKENNISALGVKDERWKEYFSNAIGGLVKFNKPNN